MTQIALAYVAAVLLAGGQGKQQGAAEPPLVRAVDAFITAASQEDEQQLPGLFGKVFAEFTQADGTARSAAIRNVRYRPPRSKHTPMSDGTKLKRTTGDVSETDENFVREGHPAP